MVEIKDSNFINKINLNLEKQLSKDFLKKNPMICGGYLYAHLLLFHKDFSKLYYNKNFYTKKLKKEEIKDGDIGYNLAEDIDIFLLENNNNFDKILNILNSEKEQYIDKSFLCNNLSIDKDTIRNFYHSKFALSLNRNTEEFSYLKKIQIIRKKSRSKEDLVSSFDIHNCAMVWQDGKVYATEKCIESILNKEINYNSKYDVPETFFDHVFQANRIFKYWNRYKKFSTLSKSSHSRILNLYVELCKDHFKEANDAKNCKFIKTKYGGYMDSRLENLLNTFVYNFSDFIDNSEHIQESELLYLIASDIKDISFKVKNLIYEPEPLYLAF